MQIPTGPRVSTGVSFLSCPYKEKETAKKLGAKWDVARKAWYVPSGVAITPFARWLPGGAVNTCNCASSALGYPTASVAPSRARKTDISCPGNRSVATAKSEAGGLTGWWENHTQARIATALAALVSTKAAVAGCFGNVATTEANAVAKADMEANAATKAELVTAKEANAVTKAELAAAKEANSVTKTELAAAKEANSVMKTELAAAKEINSALKAEFEAANEAVKTTVAITAEDAVAAAAIAATVTAIATVAVSAIAISVATAFASPIVSAAAPEAHGATHQTQNNMIIQERAEK